MTEVLEGQECAISVPRHICRFQFPSPRFPSNAGSADILFTWDRAIETLESLIAAKERRKQAIMEQLLSGSKRLPDFTGKWHNTQLGKLAENVSVRNNGKPGWDRLYAVTIGTELKIIPIASGIRKLDDDKIHSLPSLSNGGPVPSVGIEILENDLTLLFADNSLPSWARSSQGPVHAIITNTAQHLQRFAGVPDKRARYVQPVAHTLSLLTR